MGDFACEIGKLGTEVDERQNDQSNSHGPARTMALATLNNHVVRVFVGD
ncbi:MAG: hypothetical protein JWM57_707, partial [Phycisphaerales bacterium]|nr:hypothetical protein [Phycisphaerales bacterium]